MTTFLLLILLVGLAFYISSRPDFFSVTRSISINAAPEAVFPWINDLKKWQPWSPWVRMEPTAKVNFEGITEGAGAAMTWEGQKTGAGRMAITESVPPQKIVFRLDFYKPMQGTSITTFTLTPEGSGTHVSWTMEGKNNFVAKAMGLVMNCDKMVGGQFEDGLRNLKDVAENAPR
jgi:uncharacterized protein YndB with AHSA1/START domain